MSSTFRTPMALTPIMSSTEIVDPSAGHGGYRVRRSAGTAGRGTLVQSGATLRPQTAQDLFEMSRAATGANGASGAGNGTSASVDYDVGVDTVLQEAAAAAAAAAGGSSYYPEASTGQAWSHDQAESPFIIRPDATPGIIPSYEIDTMTVSGDIEEEPKEGVMGFIEQNPKYAAAIAAVIGFLGYRYAKKQGMI